MRSGRAFPNRPVVTRAPLGLYTGPPGTRKSQPPEQLWDARRRHTARIVVTWSTALDGVAPSGSGSGPTLRPIVIARNIPRNHIRLFKTTPFITRAFGFVPTTPEAIVVQEPVNYRRHPRFKPNKAIITRQFGSAVFSTTPNAKVFLQANQKSAFIRQQFDPNGGLIRRNPRVTTATVFPTTPNAQIYGQAVQQVGAVSRRRLKLVGSVKVVGGGSTSGRPGGVVQVGSSATPFGPRIGKGRQVRREPEIGTGE